MPRNSKKRIRISKEELDKFHNELVRKHQLEDFFKRNPDLDKYFMRRIHAPILKILKELRQKPSYSTLKRGTRLFLRLRKYLEEATIGREQRDIDLSAFKRNIGLRKENFRKYVELGVIESIATAWISKHVASNPQPTNTAIALTLGAIGSINLFLAGKARLTNPIGYKVYNRIKNKEELERITALIYDHYLTLYSELRNALKKLDKQKKRNWQQKLWR